MSCTIKHYRFLFTEKQIILAVQCDRDSVRASHPAVPGSIPASAILKFVRCSALEERTTKKYCAVPKTHFSVNEKDNFPYLRRNGYGEN